jgi:hypothetical protein
MKKLVILSLFISTTVSAQFFESNDPYYEKQDLFYQNEFFSEPEQETTNIPDPFPSDEDDPVPIDNWQLVLSSIGIFIAASFLFKQKKMA